MLPYMIWHSVHPRPPATPPAIRLLRGGGVELPSKFSKKGGGVAGKELGYFFQGGELEFLYIK